MLQDDLDRDQVNRLLRGAVERSNSKISNLIAARVHRHPNGWITVWRDDEGTVLRIRPDALSDPEAPDFGLELTQSPQNALQVAMENVRSAQSDLSAADLPQSSVISHQ